MLCFLLHINELHFPSLYHHHLCSTLSASLSLYISLLAISPSLSLLLSLVVAVLLFWLLLSHLQERTVKTSTRMHNPKMIMKQDFIKKWTIALKTCYKDSSMYMTLREKQNTIKQTAAIAMAAAKQGSTAWSRAILANEYKQMNNELKGFQHPVNSAYTISSIKRKLTRSKRIRHAKRSTQINRKAQKASFVAKSIIKKQTDVLTRLLPGGKSIDECCLIGEALDYIVSLQAQVDVMKELVVAAEYMKKP